MLAVSGHSAGNRGIDIERFQRGVAGTCRSPRRMPCWSAPGRTRFQVYAAVLVEPSTTSTAPLRKIDTHTMISANTDLLHRFFFYFWQRC